MIGVFKYPSRRATADCAAARAFAEEGEFEEHREDEKSGCSKNPPGAQQAGAVAAPRNAEPRALAQPAAAH